MTDRTTFPAMCLTWNEKPVSAIPILVTVRGHLIGPQVGDIVDIAGRFVTPSAPANPGEYDFRKWMSLEGYAGTLIADHPRHVTTIRSSQSWFRDSLSRLRTRLRKELDRSIDDPQIAAVAAAITLGDRSDLPDDVKESFIRSGTFHLLAISGLHVGLLTGLIMRLFRLANMSVRRASLTTILLLVSYASLTGFRPSVFRATIFLVIYLGGRCLGRQPSATNSLGLTGFLLLLWNPENLFASGVQLSFLSVIAILTVRPMLSRNTKEDSLYDRMQKGLRSSWERRMLLSLKDLIRDGVIIGFAVTLFTLPVIADNFHLFPFWGVPVTILLIPVVTLALCVGILLILSSILAPGLCGLWGGILKGLLSFLVAITSSLGELSVTVWRMRSVPEWWLAGYLGIALSLVLWKTHQRKLWLGFFVWGLLHIGLSQFDDHRNSLKVTTYSVGHGLAILLEFPDGQKHLYDCGASDGGQRAAEVLLRDFRMRGIRKLNRVYLSHADLDHYSAFPEILDDVEVSEIVTTEDFLLSKEPNIQSLLQSLRAAGCDPQIAQRGTTEVVCEGCRIDILHPQEGEIYSSDNAASLVLKVRYANSALLLTGDIELEGLFELLDQPSEPVDLLLAPHHGSAAANTSLMAKWCTPRIVVASCGHRFDGSQLREAYGKTAKVYETSQDGAIIFTVHPDGKQRCEAWKNQSSVSD
ncbi:MAG: DNA internalization-related competence protein ComEC/Rec2 [Planctomycetaceae bacterium]|nr:DNA internalization-related competence protein ComEC/Rec2 [Planctomycetaceae bacterium]